MIRFLLIILFSWSALWSDFTHIYRENNAKSAATTLYTQNDVHRALEVLDTITKVFKLKTPEVYINKAHSQFLTDSFSLAKTNYSRIKKSDSELYSIARLQAGVAHVYEAGIALENYPNISIDNKQAGVLRESLAYFKRALIANPNNEEARYNFELIKLLLDQNEQDSTPDESNQDQEPEEEQDEEQEGENEQDKDQEGDKEKDQEGDQQEDKDQEGDSKEDNKEGDSEKEGQDKDQEGESKKDQEKGEPDKNDKKENGEEKNGEPDSQEDKDNTSENAAEEQNEQEPSAEDERRQQEIEQRLEEQNLTKEQAMKLLESLNQQEQKYIQQQKRKSQQKTDPNKPDW